MVGTKRDGMHDGLIAQYVEPKADQRKREQKKTLTMLAHNA